jgi:parallel beta-helix repeat protein
MKVTRLLPLLASFLLPAVAASAATLCVSSTGNAGCYTSIAAATSAASAGDIIKVGPGEYAEGLVISKPLSLVGEGATINATGQTQGIRVDGLATPGLTAVHISGFTIKNANLEGILVMNASGVTVSGNTVLNNNLAVVGGTCTMLPSYEPGEAQDCGEGIHLQGADHTIVTNNTVQGNAGGILISDDTGLTHDNLISFNTVSDNPYACGITMASHVPAAVTGSPTPFGVYHNTIYANRSQRNGRAIGGGAGIGIFASVPFAKAYGNVVVDNLVSENGLPGIAMHAHAPFQSLNDNMIVGNTVVSNGADSADATTPGPTGINLYSLTPVTGNIISGNSIQGESYDVMLKVPALVQVNFNGLLGLQTGVGNLGVGPIDATENWWSCPNGPSIPGSCSFPSGNNVVAFPGLSQPIPPQPNY